MRILVAPVCGELADDALGLHLRFSTATPDTFRLSTLDTVRALRVAA